MKAKGLENSVETNHLTKINSNTQNAPQIHIKHTHKTM